MPEVVGVYPVRTAFPASESESLLSSSRFGPSSGHRAVADLPGYDGRGVTIALLDTASTRRIRICAARSCRGSTSSTATTTRQPARTRSIRRRSSGTAPSSPGSSSVPAAPAGCTASPRARRCCRSGSQVAAGSPTAADRLRAQRPADRRARPAVDPNGDGDAHDAVRVALVGVAEPYAAFTDSPRRAPCKARST